jgi:asparaginyl-tRNA synthetase
MIKPQFYISELHKHVGHQVTLKGWLYNKRSSGNVAFVIVRDGTGMCQCVLVKKAVSPEVFARFEQLTQECALEVTGNVKADARQVGGHELELTDLVLVSPAEEFPISPKEHGIDYLMTHRHLWLRSRRQHAILRVRNEIIQAIRTFFYDRGFLMFDSPILTGSIGEHAGTLFSTEYFDLGKAYLAQTGQLYGEAGAMAFGRIYTFGPTFRAEKSKTRRHLTEFWMMEPEMAFYDNEDSMQLQEEMVCYIVAWVLEKSKPELEILERDISPLTSVKSPFPRLSYDETVEKLETLGSDIKWGDDLGGDDETLLTQQYDRPVFVFDYPRAIKAFYMKAHPERDDLVKCADLLAPEGYGEIIGGSQREDDLEKLKSRIALQGLPPEAYEWYLDLRRFGSVPHSGFGLGIERTVAWICGLKHIREAIPFARTMGRLYP